MTTPDDDDLELLDPKELGVLLKRSPKSIKVEASRNPHILPPRFIVPGTRALRWRKVDVRAWMEAWAEVERNKRIASVALGKKVGQKFDAAGPFSFNHAAGTAANKLLKSRAPKG